MDLAVWQVVILIIFSFFCILDNLTLVIGMQFPVIVGTITGLIVGDVTLGLTIGATLQLMVLGVGTYGGASVPDFTTGAIVGTAFAHISGKGIEFALAIAVPVGLLMVQLDVLARFANTFFLHRIDENIEALDTKGIARNTVLGMLPWGLSRAIPVGIMLIFGQRVVDTIVNDMPDWLMGGLKVAGGLLPVVGIAVLLKYLPTNKYITYLIVGFVAAAYLKMPMLGVALVGLALAIHHFNRKTSEKTKMEVSSQAISDINLTVGGYEDGEYEEE
ncbi:PTS sugar transporter subunit IIC [Enterococcus faecium]|nr:PTS sugar transporter subunit IIC [Enterococcus faecium]